MKGSNAGVQEQLVVMGRVRHQRRGHRVAGRPREAPVADPLRVLCRAAVHRVVQPRRPKLAFEGSGPSNESRAAVNSSSRVLNHTCAAPSWGVRVDGLTKSIPRKLPVGVLLFCRAFTGRRNSRLENAETGWPRPTSKTPRGNRTCRRKGGGGGRGASQKQAHCQGRAHFEFVRFEDYLKRD